MLQELADSFPERVQRFDLSETTFEGRPIWGVKVSTDLSGNSNKKAIWVETGTHAREFVTISVGLATIDNVSEYLTLWRIRVEGWRCRETLLYRTFC